MLQGLSRDYLKQPEWSSMRESSYGHGTLDFESPTSAVFRWHRNQVSLRFAACPTPLISLTFTTTPRILL